MRTEGVRRLTLWRMPARWWAFLLLGIPALTYLGAALSGLLGVVALSVIVTALFDVSRGSLLIAALFHFQMMNPILPEAQPWENVVVALVAIVIVLRNPAMMLRGEGAVTDVLMEEREPDAVRPAEGSVEPRRA